MSTNTNRRSCWRHANVNNRGADNINSNKKSIAMVELVPGKADTASAENEMNIVVVNFILVTSRCENEG